MGIINQLPPDIANKIAAGEVVERPASVVKELVENAIDAGATRIDVELEDAGKQLVRVADNGCGMDQEDLPLAFAPHATSKISQTRDLFYIDTMGFRGEALASIASISHARIVSRTPESASGYELVSNGGELSEIKPVAADVGTTIEVGNLFFNTPVRRRFLRQNSTEVGHVADVLQRLALAHPAVGFSLASDGRRVFQLPANQSLKDRVTVFAGPTIAKDLIEVADFDEYASLSGYVASVDHHKPNSKHLALFVNRRYVRDRSLLHAITLAYREFIPHGRYPVAYLFLELDPSEVDVNVHPTKIEVRFTQANRLFSKIKAAVQESLLRSGKLPSVDLNSKGIGALQEIGRAGSQAAIHAAMADFMSRAGTNSASATATHVARPGSSFETELELATPSYDQTEERPALINADALRASRLMKEKGIPTSNAVDFRRSEFEALEEEVDIEERDLARWRDDNAPQDEEALVERAASRTQARQGSLLEGARGLFQVAATFLFVETDQALIVIDQHAYHERILFWQLEHRLQTQPIEVQRLLVPEPLELSIQGNAMLGEQLALFAEFGFEVGAFGADGWALYAVPRFVRASKINEFIAECLDEMAESGRTKDPASLRKSMVEMMACRASVKAGDVLSTTEIENLLREGEKIPHTFACPHGRPTTFRMGFEDLEKLFHRR